jgi:anti-anti-sigma regulatory factor
MIGHAPDPADGHQLDLAPTGDSDPALARWARRGARNDEGMVYVADDDTPDVTALVTALAAQGVDTSDAADEGQLVVVEPARFYGGGYQDLIEAASDGGSRPVRTFGGPRLAAQVLTESQFEDFESRLASSWSTHGVTSMCRYHARDLAGADGLARAFARHRSGWGEHHLHAHHPSPGLLVLDGEADLSNKHVMGAAFTEALRDAGPLLVVDCAQLRFAAVGAWHAAAASARQHRDVEIRLVGTSALTRRMLAVLQLPGSFTIEVPGSE